jgi:acetyltransferase
MLRYKELKDHLKDDIKTLMEWNIAATPAKSEEIKQASYENIISRLKKFKLPFCPYMVVENAAAAVHFHKEHGAVVLKIANEEIVHKSDLGLVKLNLSTPGEVTAAFDDILMKSSHYLPGHVSPRILVQKMVTDGIELVLGAKRDPHFGPTIMFGLGGILVELYKDVVFRVLPIGYQEAKRMINEIQGINILKGFRGYPKINLNTLARIIVKFTQLISTYPEIQEMDLNPIIWPKEASKPIIVDCRMTELS